MLVWLLVAQLLAAVTAAGATVRPAQSAARRELQRTATDVRLSGTVDMLRDASCRDDPQGFLEWNGLTCSGQTMHQTEEECEQAGFEWRDDHENSNLHHCWRSDLVNYVRQVGCGGWFLGGMFTVADLCPFTCYGCEESVPFDALNRLFLDLTINLPDISIIDVANAKGEGGWVPTISLEMNSFSCHDISLGKLEASTAGPERRPGVLLDGSVTPEQDEVTMTIAATNVMLTCQLDFQWCMFSSSASTAEGTDLHCSTGDPTLSGRSTVEINTARGMIELDMVLSSPNLAVQPPCLPAGKGYAHRSLPEQACTGKKGTLQPRMTFSNGTLLPAYAGGGMFEGRKPFCQVSLGTMHEVDASGDSFTADLINFVHDFGWPWSWGEGDFLQEYIICSDCDLIELLRDFLCKETSSVFNSELGGAIADLSAIVEPYVNPNAEEYLCRTDEKSECREEHRFRGPLGMTRGQRWPAGDAVLREEALLSDPRILNSTIMLQGECAKTRASDQYAWIDGACRKPLVSLPESWLMQRVNESVRRLIGKATDPPTEITLAEDGSWDSRAVNELFSKIKLGPLEHGVLNLTDLAIATGGDLASILTTKWNGNYTVRANELNISGEEAKINDARAINISASITVDSLTVSGLNNFTRFHPLQFIGRYSLGTGLALNELQMEAALTLTITAPDNVGGALGHELIRNGASMINGFRVLQEPLTVHASLKDLSIEFAVMLALNQNSVSALTLGELLDPDLREKCLMSTIEMAEITKLELNFADIEEPVIGGFVSTGFDQFVQQLVHGLYVTYKDVGSTAVHNAMQTSVREWINDKISTYINDPVNSECRPNTDKHFGSGQDAKFPWYFSLGDSLERYGLTEYGLTESPLAYAKHAINALLAAVTNDRESDGAMANETQQTLDGFDYTNSELLYVYGLDSVVMEPAPDILVASGEASTTARIIDEPTSLHNHVTLQTFLAAAYLVLLLPFTPKEITADWTSQQMATCTPAELLDIDASDIGMTFDFDLRIPNIKLHALRLVDLQNTDYWMKTLEWFSASGRVDIGEVRDFAVSCGQNDGTLTSCSAETHEAESRSAAFDTAEKNQLASLLSDAVSAVVKTGVNGLAFCEKTVFDASVADREQCPRCPDWMDETVDPLTGLEMCVASAGWIREDCDTLNRVAGDLSKMLFGDSDELVASDAWLQAERSLPQDNLTRYLDLNLAFITDTLATNISKLVSEYSFDEIRLDNPLGLGSTTLFEPDQSRSVNLSLSELGTIPISVLPSHGLNLSLDTLDIAMGPMSSVHMLQMCPDSPGCGAHGFSLGAAQTPGRYTLWHTATLDRLELSAEALVTNWIEDQVNTQRLQVNTTIRDFKVIAATMIAINLTALERLKLAPLFSKHEESVVACALTSISSTALTNSWASVSDVSTPDIAITGEPLQSPAAAVLGSFSGAAICIAEPIFKQSLPSMLGRGHHGCYRDTFNAAAKWYLDKMHSKCNMSSAAVEGDLAFQRGSIQLLNLTALLANDGAAGTAEDEHNYCSPMHATSAMFQNHLQELNTCPDDGFGCDLWSKIEKIVAKDVLPWEKIRCAFQTATIPDRATGWPSLLSDWIVGLNGHRFEQLVNISGNRVKVAVDAVTLNGLARGYNASFLTPVNDVLRTNAVVGTLAEPFNVTVDMQVGTTSGSLLRDIAGFLLERQDTRYALSGQNAMMTSHNFTLTLSAHGAHAFLDVALGINLRKLADLILSQVANLQCWESVFEHLRVYFGLSLGMFAADVKCHGSGCHCTDYSTARTEAECKAAACDWIDDRCKPDWLTSMKNLWYESTSNLRFKEGFEGVIASLSNLVNYPVGQLVAPDEFVRIRDYATNLYASLGMIDVAAPMGDGVRADSLRDFEQLVVQNLEMTGAKGTFMNLKSDVLVKKLLDSLLPKPDDQPAILNSLVEKALPGGNFTMLVGMPFRMPIPVYSITSGKTWFEKLVEGVYKLSDLLESEESQDWVLQSVTLTGLNSLQSASMFKATEGNLTSLHQATFKQLGVVFHITVKTIVKKPPEEYNVWWSCVQETKYENSTIVMGTHITNVQVQAATLLALDLDALFETQLGRILHEPVGCALSAVKAFNISLIDIGGLEDSQMVPYFSTSGDGLAPASTKVANLLRASEALLEPLLKAHLPSVLNSLLPVVVTDAVSSWVEENAHCPAVSQEQRYVYPDGSRRPPIIDFVNNPLYKQLHQLIETHKSKINQLVADFVESITTKKVACPEEVNGISLNRNCSGVLIMMRDNVPGEERLRITTAGFDLQISNLMLTGLNNVGASLEILDPVAVNRLNTSLMAENIGASAHLQLKLNHRAELAFDVPTTYDDFYISIGTDAVRFVLGLILEIKTRDLWSLTLNNLNIEDCWRSVLRDHDFDLYELALQFGIDPMEELNLSLHCLSCESAVLRRIDASLQEPASGSKLGSSLNNILRAMARSVVSGTGFNLPQQDCKEINGNTSIILQDVLSLGTVTKDSSVATKTYAAVNENDFVTDPQRGGSPTLNLVNLRCDEDIGCSFDGLKETGAAGLVRLGLDQAQKALNAGLVEMINKAIEAGTCAQPPCWEHYVEIEPVLLRDSTQSLPRYVPEDPIWDNSAVHFLDNWVQESGEKWELTGVRLKSLHSVRNVTLAKPLDVPEQNGRKETYTLWNEISMGEIVVELNISVVTERVAAPFTCNSDEPHTDTDTVIITTGARDLHVGIATLLAIDEDKMNALQAGQFFNDSLSCLVSTIHTLEVTAANFSIGSLISPTMEKDMDFGKLEHLVLGLVGPAICVAQPVLNMVFELALGPAQGDINLREIANGLISQQLSKLASECKPLSSEPPHFFNPYFNFKTAEAKIPFLDKMVNIMGELSRLINDVQPQTINKLMPGRWQYTRTEQQTSEQNNLCDKPCNVEELELCWGNWGTPGDEYYQPDNRSCSAETWENGTTGVGYERKMFSNSCGRSCSSDPNMFFEFFKRPQNASVTGRLIPDKVGVLGEMVIEVTNIHVTGLEHFVYDMQLLDVVACYAIGNSARLFVDSPATLSMDVKVGVSGMRDSLFSPEWPPVGLDTDFTIAISAEDIEFALDFVLQIRDRVRSLEVVDFFNPDCAIRIIEDMLPILLKLEIGQVGLDVTCRKCTPKLLEWQNRSNSAANLVELTDTLNAFIKTYTEHFEVGHDAPGPLMHTAEDRHDSDEHMHALLRQWLWKRQGLSEMRTGAAVVDGDLEYFGEFEVTTPDDEACKGMVHRTSALEEMNATACGELVIDHSTYGDAATFDSLNDEFLVAPKCNGLGQECKYRCQPLYHLQGGNFFDRVGTVLCQENGEYTDVIPCVHTFDTTKTWFHSTKGYLSGELLIVGGIMLGICFTWCCARKRRIRHRRKLEAGDMLSQEEEHRKMTRVPTKGDGSGTGQGHRSLLKNTNLPRWVRYYVPIVLIINVGFFVMGHIYTAASVDIVLKLFGREVRIDGIVTMSLAKTISDMIAARAWLFIILLGGMSGVWPYTKLTLIFSSWMLPPSRLRPKRRGQVLMTLDALGKWSLIDLYVMLFFMLAFRVNVINPSLAVLPPALWSGDLKLTAVWGLFAFTIAVISSLIVNNLAIHYHRNALAKEHSANLLKQRESALVAEHQAQDEQRDRARALLWQGRNKNARYAALDESVEDAGLQSESGNQQTSETSWYSTGTTDVKGVRKSLVHSREALCHHVFSLEHYEIWFPVGGRMLVSLLLVASIALTICGGFCFDCFVVNCYGMGAAAMEFGTPGSSMKHFTVYTSFTYIMEQADTDETQEVRNGIYALAYCYIIFAIIIPLLQQLGLLVLWTTPLTLRQQKIVFFTIEVLHGWAAMPVFLVGLAVSILKVGDLSASLIPKFGEIDDLLRALHSWDIISETDADAGLMQITMEARDGLWLLAVACVCEYLGATIVVRSAEVCIDEREWRISGRPPNEEQEMGCGKPIMSKLLQGTTCCWIPISPGLRYMPRFFVKRHNLSKLLLSGANTNSSLSPEDQQELFRMTALLSPMDGVDKAGVAKTSQLRRSMTVRRTDIIDADGGATSEQSDLVPEVNDGYESNEEVRSWNDSVAIAMAEATLTQWKTVAATRKRSKLRLGSSSDDGTDVPTSLPPGWTTTMWRGEVYFWNSITGQTTATPPGDNRTPTPKERWHRATAGVTTEALDVALEELVRRREQTERDREETDCLDESMPYQKLQPEPEPEPELEPEPEPLENQHVESHGEEAGLGIVRSCSSCVNPVLLFLSLVELVIICVCVFPCLCR